MNEFNTNKLIAYLTLISGLMLSVVAEYYSIVGLTAIFSAAVIPIIIMGIAIGLGKVVGTVWLKQNWKIAPFSIKIYLSIAIVVLMLITSMGIFGFLSKAHSDQSLISGDVQSKIAIYDEKIKTAKDNIETNRKQLKQMDEAVDQIMGRSSDEKGADKANAVRKSQQRDRQALAKDIETNQKLVASLNDEAAPIRAEVRKVEAEVGPIKYIAAFAYGSTDEAILERAVTWIILLIIFVFDPLAVILLISSQVSFQKIKDDKNDVGKVIISDGTIQGFVAQEIQPVASEAMVIEPEYKPDDGPLSQVQIDQIKETANNKDIDPIELWNKIISAVGKENKVDDPVELPPQPHVWKTTVFPPVVNDTESNGYVQNEEQTESSRWNDITQATQISEKDYHDAIERNIEEMVESVKRGILPFYKVPYEIQDQVKQKLQNDNETNPNNPS